METETIDVSTVQGKLAAAEKLKAEGNELFKQKLYKKAIRKYRTVFAYVRLLYLWLFISTLTIKSNDL